MPRERAEVRFGRELEMAIYRKIAELSKVTAAPPKTGDANYDFVRNEAMGELLEWCRCLVAWNDRELNPDWAVARMKNCLKWTEYITGSGQKGEEKAVVEIAKLVCENQRACSKACKARDRAYLRRHPEATAESLIGPGGPAKNYDEAYKAVGILP